MPQKDFVKIFTNVGGKVHFSIQFFGKDLTAFSFLLHVSTSDRALHSQAAPVSEVSVTAALWNHAG